MMVIMEVGGVKLSKEQWTTVAEKMGDGKTLLHFPAQGIQH